MATKYTETQLLNILRKRVADSTQRQVAEELGISRPFLNDVLHGNRNLTETLVQRLGFERVVTYRKVA